LPTKEPQFLQNWQDIDIYGKLRDARKGAHRHLFFMMVHTICQWPAAYWARAEQDSERCY